MSAGVTWWIAARVWRYGSRPHESTVVAFARSRLYSYTVGCTRSRPSGTRVNEAVSELPGPWNAQY